MPHLPRVGGIFLRFPRISSSSAFVPPGGDHWHFRFSLIHRGRSARNFVTAMIPRNIDQTSLPSGQNIMRMAAATYQLRASPDIQSCGSPPTFASPCFHRQAAPLPYSDVPIHFMKEILIARLSLAGTSSRIAKSASWNANTIVSSSSCHPRHNTLILCMTNGLSLLSRLFQ